MAEVAIDGENVEFEGDPPKTGQDACQLIEGFLAGQGRLIKSISVDGREVSLDEASTFGAYEKIVFVSTTPQEQLLTMCEIWSKDCHDLSIEMKRIGTAVLRSSWSDSQQAAVALLEKLRPLIEGVGILQNYGEESGATWQKSVSESFAGALAAIDKVADSVESKNCVALSDYVSDHMSPAWRRVSDCISLEVIPELEGAVSG